MAVVEATVGAAVHAVVADVQRGEHNDTVAVDAALDFAGYGEDAPQVFGVVVYQKRGDFAVGKAFKALRLVQRMADGGIVGPFRLFK